MHCDILILEAENSHTLNLHIDTAYAVHVDMKSHTGLIFTIGKGSISSSSTKQKCNACSSNESELNGTNNCRLKVT